jgi:hypothetical protein
MNCILCQSWSKTPFAPRYNTPIDVGDAQRILAYGYAIKSHSPDSEPELCERHAQIVANFKKSIDNQREREREAAIPPPSAETAVRERILEVNRQAQSAKPITRGPRPTAPIAIKREPAEPSSDSIVGNVAVESVPRFPCPKCGKSVATGEVHPCM